MIKKYSITLLLPGVALSLIGGSFLSAADRGQRKKPQIPQQQAQQRPQAPQPKQNPFQRYNDVAQKYYEAEPTDKTVKEFKDLLEKDKFFNIKPQCKKELDLLLKDVEAKTETNNLLQVREEQTASIKKSAATIHAAQQLGIPTNLTQKGRASLQKVVEKPKITIEEKPTPKTTPEVKPTPGLPKEKVKELEPITLQLPPIKETTYVTETITTPPQPKEEPAEEKELPETVEPEVTLQLDLSKLKNVGIKPSEDQLQIVSSAEPSFFSEVAAPLISAAQKKSEKEEKKAIEVINIALNVLPTFTIPRQQKVAETMATIIVKAQKPKGATQVRTTTQKLTAALANGPIPAPNIQKSLAAVSVSDIKPIMEKNKPETAMLSPNMLSSAIYNLASQGNLEFENMIKPVDTLASSIATSTGITDELAPLVGTALVVAPNPQSVQDITQSFATALDRYDILKFGIGIRAQKLTGELKTFHETGTLKATSNWLATIFFGVAGNRTPQEIIPELIALYYMLQKMGREVVYNIQNAERNTLYLMDTTTQAQWEKGSLDLTPYKLGRKQHNLQLVHKRENYAAKLDEFTGQLFDIIEKEIKNIKDAQDKEDLTALFAKVQMKLSTDYYAIAEKKATEQFEQNLLALPATETKVPEKPKQPATQKPQPKPTPKPTQKPTITTGTKTTVTLPAPSSAKASDFAKATSDRPVSMPQVPAVITPPTTEQPKREEVVEKIPETALVRAETAHPVTTPSAKQQLEAIKKEFELIKKELEALERNIVNIDLDQLLTVERKLTRIQKNIDQNEYIAIAEKISLIDKWISPIQRVQESIQELKTGRALTTAELNRPEEQLKLYKDNKNLKFPEAVYKQLTTEINTATQIYIMNIVQALEGSLLKLHTKVAADINAYDDIPGDIYKQVDSLSTLKKSIPSDVQPRIKAILASVCALYDAILYALYTPEVFNAALSPAEKTEGAEEPEKEPIAYIELVDKIHESLKEIKFEETLVKLAELSKESTTFNAGAFNLLDITNSDFLNDDNNYKYAVAAGKEVNIDAETIPTLVAIEPMHKKELGYLEILDQWKNRVEKNDTIKKLIDFAAAGITPENIEDIKKLAAELEEADLLSTLGEEFIAKLETEVKATEQSTNINASIEALKKKVTEARTKFNDKKEITNVLFLTAYTTIQSSIEKLEETKRQPLMTQLNDVAKLFGDYLIDIITKNFITTLSTLPAAAYKAESDILQTITSFTKLLELQNMLSLDSMLSQVKELPLITTIDNATNPFHALASTVIQGFGYILATFDAVSAKLADGAKVDKSFWQRMGFSGSPTQYDIARKLIDSWLPAINKLRKDYYARLIEPFLSDANAIKEQYQKNKLWLKDLGLTGIGEAYPYSRTEIKGYPQQTNLPIRWPNGFHKPIMLKATGEGLEEDPYAIIIKQWTDFIAESLKSADVAARQKDVEEKLKAIVSTKVAGAPFESINQENEKNNFVDRLSSMKEADLYQIITELNALTKLMTDPKLLDGLKQLKELTPQIQDYIDQICGNSFALLDGLIYWIYKTTKDSNKSDRIVGEIAAALQEPIAQLALAALQYEPYSSSNFTYLQKYTSKPKVMPGTKIPSKIVYRYFIGDKATANVDAYKKAKFKNDSKILLLQTGDTLDEEAVKKQLRILDAMINKIRSPLNKLETHKTDVIAMIAMLAGEQKPKNIQQLKADIIKEFDTMAAINAEVPETEQERAKPIFNEIADALITVYRGIQ
jgi:hypothetical protein